MSTQIDVHERSVALVMGHNLTRDRDALRAVLASHATFVGSLGPRHRTASLARALPELLTDPRIHAPVGLHLGAETPEEIALAIAAEVLAHLRDASARPLRDRKSIHTTLVE